MLSRRRHAGEVWRREARSAGCAWRREGKATGWWEREAIRRRDRRHSVRARWERRHAAATRRSCKSGVRTDETLVQGEGNSKWTYEGDLEGTAQEALQAYRGRAEGHL